MRAIVYVRVSSEESAKRGLSLDAQEAACRDYCSRSDLTVASVIRDEGVSAGIPLGDRPGGKQVLQLIGAGEASHVVAMKLDRAFRDVADAAVQTRAWMTLGVTLHLLDMGHGPVDTKSAAGELQFNVLSSFAQFERSRTGERVRDALRKLPQEGRQTGFPPLGYRRDGKRAVVDEEEAKLVRELFTRYSKGATIAECTRWLNGIGSRTRYGNL